LTVRVHIIMQEQHGPETLYGSWVFTSPTISATVVLGWHSMVAVEAAATPYIPAGRVVRFIYVMDTAGRFLHLATDYVLTMIIMTQQGPYLLDFQLELAPIVPLHTLGAMELAASPTESASSMSVVPKLSKLKGKSTARGIATDKDRKAAKGTMVVKVAKVPTVKGTPAKEAPPAKELRPAQPPMGVKHPGAGTAVKSTPATTTSSPDKSVQRLTAPDPARSKRDAKTSKPGPATKSIPITATPKGKLITKPATAARGIPATEGEHGTQAAPRLASGMETASAKISFPPDATAGVVTIFVSQVRLGILRLCANSATSRFDFSFDVIPDARSRYPHPCVSQSHSLPKSTLPHCTYLHTVFIPRYIRIGLNIHIYVGMILWSQYF